MGILEKKQQETQKQIILIAEAIKYLAEIDDIDLITVGEYITDDSFLKEQAFLLLINSTKIKPTKIDEDNTFSASYEPYCYYGELKTWINDFINKNVIHDKLKILGIAKKRFLFYVSEQGFNVSDDDLIDCLSPIYDDMNISDRDVTGFAFYENLPNDYNILLDENNKLKQQIKELKEVSKNLQSYGYLDPNNKNFSLEMKLCHDTWNYIYSNDNDSQLSHTQQVKNYLTNDYEIKVNSKAIERITTITKPKTTLAP